MSDSIEKTLDYLDSLAEKLNDRTVVHRSANDVANFPIAKGQCFYILDYKTNTITYQKGIKEFLGYNEKEFSDHGFIKLIHPDDTDMMSRLIKATLMFASENDVSNDVAFFVTYRIRKKDGSYVKVMRQSTTYDLDNEGKIISNFSFLSDISFMNSSNKVEWNFEAPGLDKEKFKKYVTKEYKGFFSDRELEIIKYISKGLSSKEIGAECNLSKHTVDTHRRNILNKAHCKNTVELLNFCKLNGILIS